MTDLFDNRFYVDRYDDVEFIEHLASLQRVDEAYEAIEREIRLHAEAAPDTHGRWTSVNDRNFGRVPMFKVSAEYHEWCEFERLLKGIKAAIPKMAAASWNGMTPSQRDRVSMHNRFFRRASA